MIFFFARCRKNLTYPRQFHIVTNNYDYMKLSDLYLPVWTVNIVRAAVLAVRAEFGFKYDKLIEFLTSRYNYINELVYQLVNRCSDFNQAIAKTKIARDSDIITDLHILETEISKRRAGNYYKWNIRTLIRFFSSVITCKANQDIVSRYLAALETVIDEIAARLLRMDFAEFNSDAIIHPRHPSELNYDFEKVFNRLEHPDYAGMYEHHLARIQEYLDGYVCIDKIYDYDQVYLLINAALYEKMQLNK